MSVTEAKQMEATHIRIRGNVHVKGEQVPRGFLQVATSGSPPSLPETQLISNLAIHVKAFFSFQKLLL